MCKRVLTINSDSNLIKLFSTHFKESAFSNAALCGMLIEFTNPVYVWYCESPNDPLWFINRIRPIVGVVCPMCERYARIKSG